MSTNTVTIVLRAWCHNSPGALDTFIPAGVRRDSKDRPRSSTGVRRARNVAVAIGRTGSFGGYRRDTRSEGVYRPVVRVPGQIPMWRAPAIVVADTAQPRVVLETDQGVRIGVIDAEGRGLEGVASRDRSLRSGSLRFGYGTPRVWIRGGRRLAAEGRFSLGRVCTI